MKLIKKSQKAKMLANWKREMAGERAGPPVLKLFNLAGAATWLFTSMDPGDEDTMFGLCDLGFGCPEMGYASLSEIGGVRAQVKIAGLSMPIGMERDIHFRAEHPLRVYADAARANGSITEIAELLEEAAARVAERDAREAGQATEAATS